MAAELTFKNVLSHIQQSGLNFSIYLTPFSAQLSLKKSFAKKFYQEPVDEVKIEENLGHSLEAKVEQLESRLKKIDSENHKLVENLKEREEALETLQTKCDMMEETLKLERKKSKKERQKLEKKNSELITNIKLEPKEEEEMETDEVIAEVVTSNKFEPLISTSDQDERDSRINKSIKHSGSCIDITPEPKISKAVQTSSISISQVSKEYEKYACFYCEKEIASEQNLIEHRVTCHGATETPNLFSFPVRPRPLLFKCIICGLVASSKAEIVNHKKSVHTDQ
jgi:hypothetical protein